MVGSVPFLGIPVAVQEVVVQGHGASVVEDDGTVLPGDGLAPPFVIDTPGFPNRLDPAGGASRQSNMDRLSLLVGADVHGPGATQGT
jgi:hypothetical protein